jgi:hypothetical protein
MLGLVAQGAVIIDTDSVPANSGLSLTLHAEVVAATDRLTLNPQWVTTPVLPGAPAYGNFTLDGSLASAKSPAIKVGATAGFQGSRSYSWDDRLATHAPPFFPVTGLWALQRWGVAHEACLDLPNANEDPRCA